MPVLKDIRKTETIELPSFPGSKVELYTGLLFGQVREIMKASSEFEQGVKTLLMLLKDWNLKDEKGEKIPISEETINSLPTKDVLFLLNKVTTFLTEAQKKTKRS